MLELYCRKVIELLLDKLKPEIRMKANFMIKDDGGNALADCNYTIEPPMITFHLGVIHRTFEEQITVALKEIISHELIHLIQPISQTRKDVEAYEKSKKMNFFK